MLHQSVSRPRVAARSPRNRSILDTGWQIRQMSQRDFVIERAAERPARLSAGGEGGKGGCRRRGTARAGKREESHICSSPAAALSFPWGAGRSFSLSLLLSAASSLWPPLRDRHGERQARRHSEEMGPAAALRGDTPRASAALAAWERWVCLCLCLSLSLSASVSLSLCLSQPLSLSLSNSVCLLVRGQIGGAAVLLPADDGHRVPQHGRAGAAV